MKNNILQAIALIYDDVAIKSNLIDAVENDEANRARMLAEDLLEMFPDSERARRIDTLIMNYYFE